MKLDKRFESSAAEEPVVYRGFLRAGPTFTNMV